MNNYICVRCDVQYDATARPPERCAICEDECEAVYWKGQRWTTIADLRRELLAAEREAIVSLRNRGEISPEVMRRVQRDLDLEESRIGG